MKKKIITIVGIVIALGIIVGGFFLLSSKSDIYRYTVDEENWLEKNKNNVIDLYMPSDIASLTDSGNGLFFDFIDFFSENTNVKINPVAYQVGNEIDTNYSIVLVDKPKNTDIELLSDEYIVITKKGNTYSNIIELKDLKIGVLTNEQEIISKYLDNNGLYTAYESKELLLNALSTDEVDGIVGLKTLYLKDILKNEYHISYHMSDLRKSYVLRINSDDKIANSIIRKEYSKFEKEEYSTAYNKNILDTYVDILNVSEQDLINLNSKSYIYGYIENGIYDNTFRGDLTGTNYFIIKSFASFANIDMKYNDAYDNLDELNKALISKKIDFYYDNSSLNLGDNSIKTITTLDSRIVFLTRNNSNISINSLASLKEKEVVVLKNSNLEKWISDNGIKTKTYNSYSEMLKRKNLTSDTIIVMELDNYEYYKTRNLVDFHITYIADERIYSGFMVSSNNDTFIKLFNFYLEYNDYNSLINIDYANSYEYEGLNIILLILVIILSIIIILQFISKIKTIIIGLYNRKKSPLNKMEKIKYIDNLTSLKNRAYLNDNIDKWDDSEIYPQIIVVVDLNNIAYINDNFGHQEGDKVITEAANILIQTQLPNTEIIRTDGNEFLIYMVEYEEKKAVAYIRKLNREFKNLSHGYGAAIGYSIINDAIKTIDDAVNEATLDMKTNKELMMEEEK